MLLLRTLNLMKNNSTKVPTKYQKDIIKTINFDYFKFIYVI
jgi:hypothetical protein